MEVFEDVAQKHHITQEGEGEKDVRGEIVHA
jgi:hypothetical protein